MPGERGIQRSSKKGEALGLSGVYEAEAINGAI